MTISYRELYAYMVQPDGRALVLEHIDFEHDGQTTVPLVDWRDVQTCYRGLAGKISSILDRYRPESWGLATPKQIAEPLIAAMPRVHRDLLITVRMMDVTGITVANVTMTFTVADGALESQYAVECGKNQRPCSQERDPTSVQVVR